MRIAVDVSPLSLPRAGIGNYLRGMLAGLAEASGGEHELVAFAPAGVRGRPRIEEALEGLAVERRLWTLPGASLFRTAWSRIGRPPVERFLGPLDVLHFSDWMYPPQRSGLRTTTIHDLVPLHFPELVHPRTLRLHGAKYRHAARTCDLVFCNSRFTADDVAERLAVPQERLRVAYPGLDPLFRPDGPKADLGAPYVFTAATIEPRKNLSALLEAFAHLHRRRPELKLAIAGAPAWFEPPQLEGEGVEPLGYVSDDELARLYRGASVFAYASRFEGFGIPIVEAMASRVPAVVSAHPSMDEACGEAALRADPADPEAFADALERAIDDPETLVEQGLSHAAQFTRRACGEAFLRGFGEALRH